MPDSTSPSGASSAEGAVAAEQVAVARMYERLDQLSAQTSRDLERTRRAQTAGTPAALVERDAMVRTLTQRLGALTSAERRLCFGRLDFSGSDAHIYIGRLSLASPAQELMLTDWRAPAAEPFYRATSAEPMGVTRRRHILLEGRRVAAVEDDVLNLNDVHSGEAFEGSGALMAALAARRTGRMGDIVATIQGEQDRIIRAPLPGILVVEGGPGCGKTVVGLHRAAYLLYTHRERIAGSGVLVVGPNALFLRYISQVLPGLGEASAVLATPGQLYPGLDAQAEPLDAVAEVKGRLGMADVIAAAVRARQRLPEASRRLDVAGTRITLTPSMANGARDRARASRKPHNAARVTFVTSLLDRLASQLAQARGVDLEANREILLGDLRDSRDVRREVNLCWMPLTPEQVVGDLWSKSELLAKVAPRLSDTDRALLHREPGAAWTTSDIPLLDEAAELLGQDEEPGRLAAAVAASERAAEKEYAKGVLQLTGVDTISADALIARYAPESASRRTAADAGLIDRTWVYGHVVVDEAQELSPMQWRLLMRRCPTRSMTVVGDLAQAGSEASPRSWGAVFDALAPGRWSLESLSVNYRTPTTFMELASAVLRASGARFTPPSSVRDADPARFVRASGGTASAGLAQRVADEAAATTAGGGRAAVISPAGLLEGMAAALSSVLPAGDLGIGDAALDTRVSLLTPRQAKGLEFDDVVLVEPAAILAASPRGAHDLYVALTRATSHLVVVHSEPLPPGFPGGGRPRS